MTWIKIFRALNYVIGLFFVFAVVVQYNDPDTLIWMLVYGLTAAICFLWSRQVKHIKYFAAAVAVIAFVWSLSIIPDLGGQDAFSTFSMQSLEVEEYRESLGLILVAVWLLILTIVPQRTTEEPSLVSNDDYPGSERGAPV